MVQRENMDVPNCGSYSSNGSSKREGFLALQKQIAAKASAKSTSQASSTTKASANNWGPFKNRKDFNNMHFC